MTCLLVAVSISLAIRCCASAATDATVTIDTTTCLDETTTTTPRTESFTTSGGNDLAEEVTDFVTGNPSVSFLSSRGDSPVRVTGRSTTDSSTEGRVEETTKEPEERTQALPAREVSPPPQNDSPSDGDYYDGEYFSFSSLKERYLVSALKLRRQRCPGAVSGRTVGGVCLEKGECLLKKGSKAGNCALLGTCCYFEHSCGQTAHYKVSHFASPANIPPECELRVVVYNRDVCQIRVDFEEFALAQPERGAQPAGGGGGGGGGGGEVVGGWRCLRDRFTVDAPGARGLGFDALCGDNAGQHIYVPVNASAGAVPVRLRFQTANRTSVGGGAGGAALAAARWLLRVTQLECAPAEYDYSSLHAALASAGAQAVNKHVLAAADADLLAPQGCLQYFPERSGSFMSFNYPADQPTHRYLANLHYAICFRRRPDDCGIRHTVRGEFLIDFNEFTTQTYVDRDCDSRDPTYTPPSNYTSDDYLYVPNGIVGSTVATSLGRPFATKFCGLALQAGDTVTSYAPGPLYVYFHSDDISFFSHASDGGFQLDYEVLSGSCRLNDPGTSGSFIG